MARRTHDLVVELEVQFTPISEYEVASWHAGISLLLEWLRETEKYLEIGSYDKKSDFYCDDGGSESSLVSMSSDYSLEVAGD